MIEEKYIEIARENWLRASEEMNFKFVSPYPFAYNNMVKKIFAFLPEYGSPNGMIIDFIMEPDYDIDKDISNIAKLKNCFCSFVNIENFLKYDEEAFKDALDDWMKYPSR